MARPRKRSKDEPRAALVEPPARAGSGDAGDAPLPAPSSGLVAEPSRQAPPSGAGGARRVVAAVAATSLALGVALGSGPLAPVRVSAWAALSCLVGALACSPVAELARRLGTPRARAVGELAVRARRGIGVTAFVLALAHAGLALALHLGPDVAAVLAIDRLRHGALGLLLLAPLALTSSRRVTAALRLRGWKALHRAAYPAAILALAHAFRGPFAPPRALLGAAAVLAVLLLTRPVLALVRRPSREPLPDPAVTER